MGRGTGALGACGTFAQILVFLVNTVLFAGSVLLVTGSVLLLREDNSIVQKLDENNPNQVAYIGICLGSVTAFITFFGCAGACSQSKQIIRLYLVMLVIQFFLFLTIIILAAVYKNNFRGRLGNEMKNSLNEIQKKPNANETKRLEEFWDKMQSKIECCGLNGWEDWKFKIDGVDLDLIDNQDHEGRNIPKSVTDKTTTDGISHAANSTSDTRRKREANVPASTESHQQVTDQPEYISPDVLNRLPDSCFSNNNKTMDGLHQSGCRDKAKMELEYYVKLILIASGGVAIILVFSIGISCWLLKSVKKALAYNF